MQVKKRKSDINEISFKIIMIGDSGTGKSCLLARYTKDVFEGDYKVTIGNRYLLYRGIICIQKSGN